MASDGDMSPLPPGECLPFVPLPAALGLARFLA
jgi:hypothetical protein